MTGSLTVVKWKKDDVTIDLTDFHYQFTSDLSELDIDSVDATDAGSYQCIAQDADKKQFKVSSCTRLDLGGTTNLAIIFMLT